MSEETRKPDELSTRVPTGKRMREESFLSRETDEMEQIRRGIEQKIQRLLAKVHAVEHKKITPQTGHEEENRIMRHPELDKQRFAGVPPPMSQEPSVYSLAYEIYKQEREKQQEELQNRLGLGPQPRMGTAPTPKP